MYKLIEDTEEVSELLEEIDYLEGEVDSLKTHCTLLLVALATAIIIIVLK